MNQRKSGVGLPRDQPTIASLLRAKDYDTALIGKWHCGYPPKYGLWQNGFNEYFGDLSGATDYFRHVDTDGQPDLWEGKVQGKHIAYTQVHHYPEESLAHRVTVNGFWMDQCAITNKQFQPFVKETGYVTFAERTPKSEDYPGALPELLVPGSVVFQQPYHPVDLRICSWCYSLPARRLPIPLSIAQELLKSSS